MSDVNDSQPQGVPTTTTHVIYQQAALGDEPANVTCPHCQSTGVTNVERQSGTLAYLLGGGLCLIGCWLGCCLIPCCVDGCRDTAHRCANCQQIIGVHKRL